MRRTTGARTLTSQIRLRLILCLLSILGLAACASNPTSYDNVMIEERYNESLRKIEANSQIPIELNSNVKAWVKYFTGRGRPHMKRYLERKARYEPLMTEILREHRLPEELIYMALIESGFSWRAKSSMSAVGFWQFIRGTGKAYGLKINSQVDERRDPHLATHAAAKYIKSLYNLFGDWYLAIASYNVGENKMKRTVMRHHTRDYWQLVERKALPPETRNYIPKFQAARIIGANPERFGFTNLQLKEPLTFQEMAVFRPTDIKTLAKKMNLDPDVLGELNPIYHRSIIPVAKGKSATLRVPVGQLRTAQTHIASAYVNPRRFNKRRHKNTVLYKVKSGDSLSKIAARFGTSVGYIAKINSIKNVRSIDRGQILRVPKPNIAARADLKKLKTKKRRHKVSRGDTLLGIAIQYGVSLSSLRRANKIRPRSVLMAGSWLKIP